MAWPALPTPQGVPGVAAAAASPTVSEGKDEAAKGHKRYFIVQLRTATVTCDDVNYALRRDKAYVYDDVGCRLLAETYPRHPVVLLFTIIGTQHFQGYGTMKGQVDQSPGGHGVVPVLWECLGAVPFPAAAVNPPRAVVEEVQPARGTKVCGLLEASIASLPMGQMLLPFTEAERQHLAQFIAYYGPGVPPPQPDLPVSLQPAKKPRDAEGADAKPRKLSATAKVRKLSSAAKETAADRDPLALKVWVQGLPPATNAAHLKEYFEGFGTIVECVLIRDRQGLCTGLA
eukprot:EG_transcript_19071